MLIEDQVPTSSGITTAGKKSPVINKREKAEYHVCWRVLEAVALCEQGEWGEFNAATQQGSLLDIFSPFHNN